MKKPRIVTLAICLFTGILVLKAGLTMLASPAMNHNQTAASNAVEKPAFQHVETSAHALAMLPRPLFVISRRPPAHPEIVASRPEVLPRLSGIMIMGDVKRAIFESGNASQIKAVGDQIGSYRIASIAPMAVTIDGPRGTATLHPDSDGGNARAMSDASAASQPPSLLDQLNTQPPPVVALPRPPSLTEMLRRLPRSH